MIFWNRWDELPPPVVSSLKNLLPHASSLLRRPQRNLYSHQRRSIVQWPVFTVRPRAMWNQSVITFVKKYNRLTRNLLVQRQVMWSPILREITPHRWVDNASPTLQISNLTIEITSMNGSKYSMLTLIDTGSPVSFMMCSVYKLFFGQESSFNKRLQIISLRWTIRVLKSLEFKTQILVYQLYRILLM